MDQSDLHIAGWLHDTTTVNSYQTEIVNEGSCVPLYVELLDRYPASDTTYINTYISIYNVSIWQLIMYNGVQIQGMSPENIFRQLAQDNTGHDGLHTPNQNRSDQ